MLQPPKLTVYIRPVLNSAFPDAVKEEY